MIWAKTVILYMSTSPPLSPSPYEVVKGEGEDTGEGLTPLLNAPRGAGCGIKG